MAWTAPKGTCAMCGGRTGRKAQKRCKACYRIDLLGMIMVPQVVSDWEQMPDGIMRRTVEGGEPLLRYRAEALESI